MNSDFRRRFRFGVAQVTIAVVLMLVLTGGAFATGRYLISSVTQINPKVLKALKAKQGSRGLPGPGGLTGAVGPQGAPGANGAKGADGTNGINGTNGTNGQGPAISVTNPTGSANDSVTDATFHSIATLAISSAGSYVASATVSAHVSGGSLAGTTLCQLVAHDTSGGTDTQGQALASLNSNQLVTFATLPVQVTHTFTGPGTISLSCQQNGLTSGGTGFFWSNASVTATQVSSLSSSAVTS